MTHQPELFEAGSSSTLTKKHVSLQHDMKTGPGDIIISAVLGYGPRTRMYFTSTDRYEGQTAADIHA